MKAVDESVDKSVGKPGTAWWRAVVHESSTAEPDAGPRPCPPKDPFRDQVVESLIHGPSGGSLQSPGLVYKTALE